MELYHISENIYERGEVVRAKDFGDSTRYHQSLSEENKVIDLYLSSVRPEGEPERQLCIYAFAKMEYCLYFMRKDMQDGKKLHLYSCEMNTQNGHPMYLIRSLQQCTDEGKKEAISKDYWQPTKNWNVLEYMSDEMCVLEEIPITGALCTRAFGMTGFAYSDDASKSMRLFGYN